MLTIGSVPYLNAMPLLEGLDKASNCPLVLDIPTRLHELVSQKKVDVALLPVASYLDNPELKLIPGTGIVSHGEVRSVKVFHRDCKIDLSNTRSIYLDPCSKTSQRLLKVLLIKKYGRKLDEIAWTEHPQHAESVLEIGDKALEKSHFDNATDLGLDWKILTGLPFVYACWMSQVPITQEMVACLHNAKMSGKQCLERIAAKQKIVAYEDALSYLTHNIHYDIEGPELVGMKMFFDWVGELENQNYDTSLRFVA